ncbi:hypothetical protein [Mesorhizobium sp. M00.F.Ca.ET.217.01.1.1]|nr:hypothetical protein [Mesorhizobium sp. M00.F.Ca.ET.217.01.1.1]
MEDFIDSDDDEAYLPTPIANAVTAALYGFAIILALYGFATLLGVAK